MLGGSCEMGTVMALKSERLDPSSIGSTSMGAVPVSWSMAEGGRDCSMGWAAELPAMLLGVHDGWGLLSTELLNVRFTGGGEVMLKMSGDMGVVWPSMVAGDGGGGELLLVAIGSSFISFMPRVEAMDVTTGGEAMEHACTAKSLAGSFFTWNPWGGVGVGVGLGGLGEGFFEPKGDLVTKLLGVPPADTSVYGLNLSISWGLEPDTGRFLFFSSAFKSATLRSSRLTLIFGIVSAARDTGLAFVPWLGIGREVVELTVAWDCGADWGGGGGGGGGGATREAGDGVTEGEGWTGWTGASRVWEEDGWVVDMTGAVTIMVVAVGDAVEAALCVTAATTMAWLSGASFWGVEEDTVLDMFFCLNSSCHCKKSCCCCSMMW